MSFISPIATDASGRPRTTGSQQVLGKDDFLQLLVTKLQYQDPLEPMADEDYIAQLAQFSSLEQMNNIADGIETSNEWDFLQMQSLNNVMASGLIGNDVKATYQGFYVDQSFKSTLNYTINEYAEEVNFVIRDGNGNIVATLNEKDVQPGVNSITWDCTDKQGNRVDEGYYTVGVTATKPGGGTFIPSLSLIGTVESVLYRDGAAFLRVNGTEIPLGDITAVGQPGAFTDKE